MQEDHELQKFVAAMPKVELHAHLNGCIREETLFDLAASKKVQLSSNHFGQQSTKDTNANSLSYMYNVKPRSLKDCFEMFADLKLCVDDQSSLRRIALEALEDFAQHHVVYLELRSTPKRMKDMTKKQYIETVLGVMKDFEAKEEERYRSQLDSDSSTTRLPMKCRFLVSIDRSASVEEAEENVALAIEFFKMQDSFVVGVDVGGNPTKNDFRDFQATLTEAKQAGLKTTVHCAEVPVGEETDTDPQLKKAFEEVSAVFEFRPDRLGHALLLPASLRDKLIHEVRIPVESCPTSNVMTLELAKHVGGSLIHGLQEHPQLGHWLKSKYPLSIATDDPGVFNTNATQELLLLARAWKVGQDELRRLVVNSIDHAFCSGELKASFKKNVDAYCNQLE